MGKRSLILPLFVALVLALTLSLFPAYGCCQEREASNALTVWVTSDCSKVKRDDPVGESNHIWSPSDNLVSLKGARNEYLAFQVILRAQGSYISGASVSASELSGTGTIDGSNISLFREHYLNVTDPSSSMYGDPSSYGPGWYPDALIPLDAPTGGAPFDITNGQNQGVWVDVYIPEDTRPGSYRGTLTVSADGLPSQDIGLTLEVWDFALPRETHMKTYFYYGPEQLADAHGVAKYGDSYLELARKYVEMGHRHRINATTEIYWDYSGTGSGVMIDWDSYHDDFLSPYMDGTAFTDGIPRHLYNLPIGRYFPDPDEHGGMYSEEYEATFKTMLQRAKEHFVEKGWFDRSFLYFIDEPSDKEEYDLVRYYGRLVDESGTGFPLMVTEQPTPQDPSFGSLAGYVDIWCAGGTAYPGPMNQRRAAGDRTWTYNGGEPYAGSQVIDTSGIALRTWPWIAYRYGVEAWFLWDCMYWKDVYNDPGATNDVYGNPLTYDQRRSGTSWPDWGNGDGTFFYPGHPLGVEGPISSTRMKTLRRGLQDYEYVWLLEQQGRASEIGPVLDSLVPYAFGDAEGRGTGWSRDPDAWERGREQLAALIAGTPPEYENKVYFAEGTTRNNELDGSFEEWLCLSNPHPSRVNVTVVYALGTGENLYRALTVPAESRVTLNVAETVGNEADVSAKVTSDRELAVERPLYFDYHGEVDGGHCVAGVSSPEREWYFAEGTTRDNPGDGSFQEWLCLYNPNTDNAAVSLEYHLPGGETRNQSISVPGRTRRTVDVNEFLGPDVDSSVKVTSDIDVVAERAVYFSYRGRIEGGHCVCGMKEPADEWYFAEGTTRDNPSDGSFDEYLTIANPGDNPAEVTVRYLCREGPTRTYEVPPHSRFTVTARDDVGADRDFSLHITSDEPVVCERPMYFDYHRSISGGHCTEGAAAPSRSWSLAEGSTREGLEEWITVGNPGEVDATVLVTFLVFPGENRTLQILVPAGDRLTLGVNSFLGPGEDVAASIEADNPVIVERPMYFSYRGVREGGHCVMGQPENASASSR